MEYEIEFRQLMSTLSLSQRKQVLCVLKYLHFRQGYHMHNPLQVFIGALEMLRMNLMTWRAK
jgi:hypothetical protein